ncbi:peptidase U32 family protein [Rhodoblastus sp.]|uniref:peptidase U32 family protein n=1 Tax=Rhodoblastus sp. TaxID=1962975 RepID=UPI002633FB1F|nr:peptidase U32 family protein [Rhodoblastus sp.]
MTALLAPAGTTEMAFAAIDEGADVIYVGPLGWSRRPYESEMTDDEIRTVIDYAGARGKQVRVVFNTFPSPFEMDGFLDKARRFDAWGVSGFIVTDPGAIALFRRMFPHLVLHVSIGSGVTNAWDAQFYRALGADVIILPYRWGEEEIAQTRAASDIGLEVFLFETVQTGKICPGKCIMSSYLKFRDWQEIEGKDYFYGSANRGAKECYRVCQTKWDFGVADEPPAPLKLRRDARLMLEQLPRFVDLGVECFKLSGRERPTAMIRDLVRFYRKVLDGIESGAARDMALHADELAALQARWVSEKRKRVDTLMTRAAGLRSDAPWIASA